MNDNWKIANSQPYIIGGGAGLGQAVAMQTTRVTKRQALEARKAHNETQLERLAAENADIDEALALLDQSPLMEKLDNLITNVLGR